MRVATGTGVRGRSARIPVRSTAAEPGRKPDPWRMSPTQQAPTFIAILDLRTAPADRPLVVSQLASATGFLWERVQALPGARADELTDDRSVR